MEGKKYCSECGAENNAEALFCEECGTRFEVEEEEPVEEAARDEAAEETVEDETVTETTGDESAAEADKDEDAAEAYKDEPVVDAVSDETVTIAASDGTAVEQVDTESDELPETVRYIVEPPKPKKSYKLLIIILIILALAGAGVFAYFQFFQKTEVDLTKDLDVDILKFEGYDGSGYVYEIDMGMAMEKWDIDNQKENVQMFLETVEITTDKTDEYELSNGDTIKIIAKYKRADAKEYKIKVVGDEKTVVVKGLPEPPEDTDTDYDEDTYGEDTDDDSGNTGGFEYYDPDESEPFDVAVDVNDLNIREGPGTDYDKTGKSTGKGIFTIVEIQEGEGSDAGWGRLESGDGWIALDYVKNPYE